LFDDHDEKSQSRLLIEIESLKIIFFLFYKVASFFFDTFWDFFTAAVSAHSILRSYWIQDRKVLRSALSPLGFMLKYLYSFLIFSLTTVLTTRYLYLLDYDETEYWVILSENLCYYWYFIVVRSKYSSYIAEWILWYIASLLSLSFIVNDFIRFSLTPSTMKLATKVYVYLVYTVHTQS